MQNNMKQTKSDYLREERIIEPTKVNLKLSLPARFGNNGSLSLL
jgi:hypothetical protein